MNFFNQVIEQFKGFGTVEWGMIICIIALLITLFAFYKGLMICKDRLVAYEDELHNANKLLEHAQNEILILKGGEEDED